MSSPLTSRKGRPAAWIKIYNATGNYIASCVHPEDAAALIALHGNGSTIRNGHARKNALWVEGSEVQPAGESYDYVAQVVAERTGYVLSVRPNDRQPQQRMGPER